MCVTQGPGTNFRFLPLLAVLAILLAYQPTEGYGEDQSAVTQGEKKGPIGILSIIPSQAEPGVSVTLYGSGFTPTTRAFLGNSEIRTHVDNAKQLGFDVPDLAPGVYGLYIRREDGATSKVYKFSVTPRTPVVTSVVPDRLFACSSGSEREVSVYGGNFSERSQILFDGAIVRSRFISRDTLSLTIPRVAGGQHTIQVQNPGNTLSSVLAMFIDSKPEITGVSRGESFVTYYNLVIDGQNFQSNSRVVVDGKNLSAAPVVNLGDRERVVYVSCNRIIYERHPYSSDVKSFTVQIINPNGEESSAVQVSEP
jgi:hypothetical protein